MADKDKGAADAAPVAPKAPVGAVIEVPKGVTSVSVAGQLYAVEAGMVEVPQALAPVVREHFNGIVRNADLVSEAAARKRRARERN